MSDSGAKFRSKALWSAGLLLSGILLAAASPPPDAPRTSDPGTSLAARRMKVAFINPGVSDRQSPTGAFWQMVSAFMQAAARDLDIELDVIYAERNHLMMVEQARQVTQRDDPPDYLVVVNEMLLAGRMIQDADQAGIDVFLILNDLKEDQAKYFGAPREKYPHWIGALTPDNQLAGYLIAGKIAEAATDAGIAPLKGGLPLIAIAGDNVTPASEERIQGLKKAAAENPFMDLKQIFVAQWRRDKANKITHWALQRYPNVRAIWGANDPIALGALDAVSQAGRQAGRDIFIGGLNWSAPALAKVRQGTLATTVGGHFMIGGWALVMLYDHHHGRDFIDQGLRLRQPIFSAITRRNVDAYLARYGGENWDSIDFTKFSRVLNPDINHYDFTLDALVTP